ncbi:MAG: hypothetical protein ACR2II_10720, partial [Chthoniobacterales bacterium]
MGNHEEVKIAPSVPVSEDFLSALREVAAEATAVRSALKKFQPNPARDKIVASFTWRVEDAPGLMSDKETPLRLEIAHVLFIDIVGYSKLLI